ncbi:hypothetical protein OPQ81_011806 [Rhizoctonia solani]|nr:hypothetical protein OPQ81_011806 [Rhizoctonia solani]
MSTPPGASYRVSNALIIAKRRVLNLEDPIRILFNQEWQTGNPLYDWYLRRPSHFIQKMQLRKELESPFFHEYIVFSLRSRGGYFRIDRRQSPIENSPLDCIYEDGVEAYDTIEEVTSFDDALYCRSNPLIELELDERTDLGLAFVLNICRAIYDHPEARFYTLQRYNCYFYAQTIIGCAIRSMSHTPWNAGSLHFTSRRRDVSFNCKQYTEIANRAIAQNKRTSTGTIPDTNLPVGLNDDSPMAMWTEYSLSILEHQCILLRFFRTNRM